MRISTNHVSSPLAFIGTIVLMTVRNHDKASQIGLLISYYIVLSFWAAATLSMYANPVYKLSVKTFADFVPQS